MTTSNTSTNEKQKEKCNFELLCSCPYPAFRKTAVAIGLIWAMNMMGWVFIASSTRNEYGAFENEPPQAQRSLTNEAYKSLNYAKYLTSMPAPMDWPHPLEEPLWVVAEEIVKSKSKKGVNDAPRPTITTCIPALANNRTHDNVRRVLQSVTNQTQLADEVAIVVSDVDNESNRTNIDGGQRWCADLLHTARKALPDDLPLKIVCIGDELTAGWARNVLTRLVTSDILSFVDVDDEEYPVRNEVTRNMFECYPDQLNIFLHGYARDNEEIQHIYDVVNGHVKGAPKYGVHPDHQCADAEEDLAVFYGDDLYDRLHVTHAEWILYRSIAEGHLVVHRRVFQHGMQFCSAYRSEAIIFLRDVIFEYTRERNSTIFLNRPLTWFHGDGGGSDQDLMATKNKAEALELFKKVNDDGKGLPIVKMRHVIFHLFNDNRGKNRSNDRYKLIPLLKEYKEKLAAGALDLNHLLTI